MLKDIHAVFGETLDQQSFEAALGDLLEIQGWSIWMLETEVSKKGYMPVGFCTGWFLGNALVMSKGVFFRWASPRNIRDVLFHFFNEMRKTVIDEDREVSDPLRYMTVLQFAHFDDKKFYESMADHGILRKVGHLHDLEEKPSVVFQTRSPVRKK